MLCTREEILPFFFTETFVVKANGAMIRRQLGTGVGCQFIVFADNMNGCPGFVSNFVWCRLCLTVCRNLAALPSQSVIPSV